MLSVSGKIVNEHGDEVNISSVKANDMIAGIRAIWDMVVAAHNKDRELSAKAIDPYDIIGEPNEETIIS